MELFIKITKEELQVIENALFTHKVEAAKALSKTKSEDAQAIYLRELESIEKIQESLGIKE